MNEQTNTEQATTTTQPSAVIEVNAVTFEDATKDTKAFLKFWAPWCGPCRQMAPAFEAVSLANNKNAAFLSTNVDENQELSSRFGVRGIPTVVFLNNGVVVDQKIGAIREAVLAEWVTKCLA